MADRRGFTVIELVIVAVIVGLLAALAVPNLQSVIENSRVTTAKIDMAALELHIRGYNQFNGRLPADLDELGLGEHIDPWGAAYEYDVIVGASKKAQFRQDKFLKPLNSDYDLYSMGADGESKPALSTKVSQDDVVRALDGGFLDLAENF